MKKLLLIIAGSVLLSYSCSNETAETANESTDNSSAIEENIVEEVTPAAVQDVDVNTFFNLIENNDGQILDVRTPEEWTNGVISAEANKMDFYSDDFDTQIATLNKDMPVYVYCKSGGRSSSAADKLIGMGFKQVFNLDGGISAWEDEGKPIIK